ncbi:hypothetical protein GM545_14805 [Streptococcus pneumoniae]|uniref:Uncharacterized protein n=1 Tax=Streptococcus pneumoniae TaxID=1313 RepID=A0A7X2XML5_STREE|nr:hypothetical protein [Streptococcus pneumoniae]
MAKATKRGASNGTRSNHGKVRGHVPKGVPRQAKCDFHGNGQSRGAWIAHDDCHG